MLHAAAQWYENFKQLPIEDQSRILTSMGLTALFAKPVAGLQMKVVGIGLNGISRGASLVAGKVANAIRENPTAEAMTVEGIGLAVQAAEKFETAENIASGASKSYQKTRKITWRTQAGAEVALDMDAKIVDAFEKYGARNVDKLTDGAESLSPAASKGKELIGPKVQTFEQARNIALEMLTEYPLVDAQPYVCDFEKSKAFGKIVGQAAADEKTRWRLDWDPGKGPHVHVENISKGVSQNFVIQFEGNEETFVSLLRHLNS